jgi:hypothetical protein
LISRQRVLARKALTIDAAVAGALAILLGWADRSFSLLLLDFARRTSLGDTWNDHAIVDETLDQPVVVSVAGDTRVNTSLA